MGAFKPLLPFGNQTVLESTIGYLRRGGAETIVVVAGHRAQEVCAHVKHLNVLCVVNPVSDSEMNASIAVGVRTLPAEAKATLIALADHPAVPSIVVTKIIETWQRGAPLVVPTWQGRGGHPVLVDLRYREQLENLDPDRGLRALFDAHRADVRRLSVDSPYVARDMDTWDDYSALYQEVFGKRPRKLPPQPPGE